MKIYIDFDRTLFDCDRFEKDFDCLLKEYNISKKDFVKYQSQCKGFNPYNILKLMNKEKKIDKKIYKAIDKLLIEASSYLFSDAIPFLEYLKSKGYPVIILSRGNYDFQTNKILSCNIDLYFDDIIVTLNHKGELNLDYANSIFIDDREEEINNILEKNPMRIIFIQRNGNKKLNVETVTSLNELINNI